MMIAFIYELNQVQNTTTTNNTPDSPFTVVCLRWFNNVLCPLIQSHIVLLLVHTRVQKNQISFCFVKQDQSLSYIKNAPGPVCD